MFLEKNKCWKTCTLNHQLKINDLFINVIYNSKCIYFCIGTYKGIHGMCQIVPKQSVKTEWGICVFASVGVVDGRLGCYLAVLGRGSWWWPLVGWLYSRAWVWVWGLGPWCPKLFFAWKWPVPLWPLHYVGSWVKLSQTDASLSCSFVSSLLVEWSAGAGASEGPAGLVFKFGKMGTGLRCGFVLGLLYLSLGSVCVWNQGAYWTSLLLGVAFFLLFFFFLHLTIHHHTRRTLGGRHTTQR